MKKFIIPLLACTALAGGIAFAAAPKAPGPDGMHHRDAAGMRAEMCTDMYAHAVGRMAFVEAKLSLTPAQSGAFNAWKSIKLSEAKARSEKCSTMTMPAMGAEHSPLEHMAREEEMLKSRLADLQTERPALTTFYNSLNDTQKHELAMGRMHGGPGMHGGGMRHGGWGGGPMGHGPEDHDGPPPPPPGDGE